MLAAAVGLGWFLWYLHSLSPGLGGEDSGELVTVAATLGLSHAPGYPLHALLGRLVSLLPVGSVAFRMNLFSAACAAGALAALFHLAAEETRARFSTGSTAAALAGTAASAALGLTHAFWYQASISDKYPLNLLFFSVLVLAARAGMRGVPLAALLGTAFSHHMQTLYLLPGIAWLAFRAGWPSRRRLALGFVLFLLCVSPKILYPPLRAQRVPFLLYEPRPAAAETLDYLRATAYAAKMDFFPGRLAARETAAVLATQISPLGLAAGCAGLALWSLRAPSLGAAVWMIFGTGLYFVTSLRVVGKYYYALPDLWILAFGVGCLTGFGLRPAAPAWSRALAAAGLLPLALLVRNSGCLHLNRNSLEYDHARNLLAELPPRAAVFISGDDVIAPALYLRAVEAFRPDVVVIPRSFLTYPPYRRRVRQLVPELSGLLAGPRSPRGEESESRNAVDVFMRNGRRCYLTEIQREEVYAGLKCEYRDTAPEILAPGGGARPARPRWPRSRGWRLPVRSLTRRQRVLIELAGELQHHYAAQLLEAGWPSAAVPRTRLALANPMVAGKDGIALRCGLALLKVSERELAREMLSRAARLSASGSPSAAIARNAMESL